MHAIGGLKTNLTTASVSAGGTGDSTIWRLGASPGVGGVGTGPGAGYFLRTGFRLDNVGWGRPPPLPTSPTLFELCCFRNRWARWGHGCWLVPSCRVPCLGAFRKTLATGERRAAQRQGWWRSNSGAGGTFPSRRLGLRTSTLVQQAPAQSGGRCTSLKSKLQGWKKTCLPRVP